MSKVTRIALTGGPCAGKTDAIEFLTDKLPGYGVEVFTVAERASILKGRGITPDSAGSYEFHRLLFSEQLQSERETTERASMRGKSAVVICDRGLLDSRAYVTEEDYRRYSGDWGLDEERIRGMYDAVFHLVTAADGAEEYYNLNNPARDESPEKARELDGKILSAWVGTPHLRVIDNSTDFEGKLDRLLKNVLASLGIPEPLEIERKLLIERPSDSLLVGLPFCRRVPLSQTYMKSPEEGKFRIRKRGEGESAVYIKTVKRKISELKRIEIESYISKEEYYSYLEQRDNIIASITKDRWCFVYRSAYYELDVFPFWNGRALLEIELLDEEEAFYVPEFVRMIREVTLEKSFRNLSLAKEYGKK